MSDQLGGDGAGGDSELRSMKERLEQLATSLEQLSEEVVPGVCLMSDVPQQSLRQVAGELRKLGAELKERP